VLVAKLAQQSPNPTRQPSSPANLPERRIHSGFARRHGLEQGTLELPAARRATGIDATSAAFERGARLRELMIYDLGFALFRASHRESERSKCERFIARLEFNVLEEDAVAAEGALRAKLRHGCSQSNGLA